jgi:hypothetical protein
MSEGIVVFIEQREGTLNKTSLEAIVAAQRISAGTGDKVSAVVLGRQEWLPMSQQRSLRPFTLSKTTRSPSTRLTDTLPR